MFFALIPFLCPFDDVIILLLVVLFPAFGVWLKNKFKKRCKKSCECKCHQDK